MAQDLRSLGASIRGFGLGRQKYRACAQELLGSGGTEEYSFFLRDESYQMFVDSHEGNICQSLSFGLEVYKYFETFSETEMA